MLQIAARDRRPELEPIEERSIESDGAPRDPGESRGQGVSLRDAGTRGGAEPRRAHECEVGCRGDGGERLVRADVARRLLTADVLLARLERVHEAASTARVLCLADDPAGHLTNQRLARSEDPEMRAAERHGNAERLSLSDRDVGAEPAGRLEQRARVGLRYLDAQAARGVGCLRDGPDVHECTERVGMLDDETGGALSVRYEVSRRHLADLEARPLRVCAQRVAELIEDLARHDDLLAAGRANSHERRLRHGCRPVVHRRVHDVHGEELAQE